MSWYVVLTFSISSRCVFIGVRFTYSFGKFCPALQKNARNPARVTRKEPRVAAKRIEHRIKSEQCRSKWRARSQRTFIRYRQKFPQSNDGAGGLLQARRHPSKDLDRSRTVQRVFLDRHSGHRLLRQSERC